MRSQFNPKISKTKETVMWMWKLEQLFFTAVYLRMKIIMLECYDFNKKSLQNNTL